MDYYIERLNQELRNIFEFWQKFALQNNQIAPEVSNNGLPVYEAPLGSIYLSRLLYGSSAACMFLHESNIRPIADLAYHTLRNQLSNPNGGFYWAVKNDGSIEHDKLNISMAQAFSILGFSEYYALTCDEDVKSEIYHQIDFIESKIKHYIDNSYLDGFKADWTPLKEQYKSLSTHLHLLEAYSNFIRVSNDNIYKRSIEKILELLISRFIHHENGEIIRQFDMNWGPLPNETWIGINMETGSIVYDSACTLQNKTLKNECGKMLLSLCDHAIETGFDHQYGGMFNRFNNGELVTTHKEWWVQSESVIALLYAHQISNDKKYLSYAIRLLEYIDNSFSDQDKGEWYDSITREGKPVTDTPRLHLWKSMYHNVRYCIKTIKYLQQLFVKVC